MKKLTVLILVGVLALSLTACNGDSSKPTQPSNNNNQTSSPGNSNQETDNDLLKNGYTVNISGNWGVTCPANSSDRRNNNTYAINGKDNALRFLFGGYSDGGWKTPEVCSNLEEIVDACEDTLKDRLSSFDSTNFTYDNVIISATKQEQVKVGSIDMLKVSGTISDSHENSNFMYEAYFTLVDIDGTKAPIFLFGYAEQSSSSDLSKMIFEMAKTISKS